MTLDDVIDEMLREAFEERAERLLRHLTLRLVDSQMR